MRDPSSDEKWTIQYYDPGDYEKLKQVMQSHGYEIEPGVLVQVNEAVLA